MAACNIIPIVAAIQMMVIILPIAAAQQHTFYLDHHELLFGLQFGNSCYVQEMSSEETKHLTNFAYLVQFEVKFRNAAEQNPQHRWTFAHLLERSSSIANMCRNALDIYVIGNPQAHLPRDCQDILKTGQRQSGAYDVYPRGQKIRVYCDMESNGGGWLVFQRRKDGSVDFYRTWNSYKLGFGDVLEEFWLGNDNIYTLSNQRTYSLRVDMKSFDNITRYEEYHSFSIENEAAKYALRVSSYMGTAGDGLTYNNGAKFSTFDRDHDLGFDESCARSRHGCWWYTLCTEANLNGLYSRTDKSADTNIFWFNFRKKRPLMSVEMKIRPLGI